MEVELEDQNPLPPYDDIPLGKFPHVNEVTIIVNGVKYVITALDEDGRTGIEVWNVAGYSVKISKPVSDKMFVSIHKD